MIKNRLGINEKIKLSWTSVFKWNDTLWKIPLWFKKFFVED